MKFQNIIFQVILCVLICSSNLNAQYDNGTVIYSETGATGLNAIQKNFIVVDFDGDGYSDIIMVKSDATNNTNQLTWYKGNGNGNFSQQVILLTFEYHFWGDDHRGNEIFYTDMNGDGINDIVFQNSDTSFTVLLNDGVGNISTQVENEVIIEDLLSVDLKEIADIDGDGDKDVLFRGITKNNNGWFDGENCIIGYNDGIGNCSNYIYFFDDKTEALFLIETGDIDGDGDLDVIFSGNENREVTGGLGTVYYIDPYIKVYENLGSNVLVFKESLDIPTVNNAEPAFINILVQDINSDGTDELLIEYAIWDVCEDEIHMQFCSFSYQFHTLDYQIQNEIFITSEVYNSFIHGYILDDNYLSTEEFYDNAFHIQFGHQNADNSLDILSINVPQGKLHWYSGDGNGNFNSIQLVNFNSQYSNISPTLRVADIDNDTDLDIFVLLNDDTSSTLTVFKNLALTPTCATVLDLANTSLNSGVYQAGTTTISSGNVVAGSNVTLKAGNRIRLESGFSAPQDCTFKVVIGACN